MSRKKKEPFLQLSLSPYIFTILSFYLVSVVLAVLNTVPKLSFLKCKYSNCFNFIIPFSKVSPKYWWNISGNRKASAVFFCYLFGNCRKGGVLVTCNFDSNSRLFYKKQNIIFRGIVIFLYIFSQFTWTNLCETWSNRRNPKINLKREFWIVSCFLYMYL